jgi:serine/threonine protein phosphatase PrpC
MNERPATPAEAAAPHRITLSWGSNTDRGLRRELNEDSFLAADPIFAVADGMGGHEAGEVASRECIRALREAAALAPGSRTASALDVQQALLQADAKIRELTDSRAGTTATGVVLVEEAGNPYWLVFNVGDSRTYRLSQGKFEQISVDHSEVQELVDAGHITSDQALVHPRRHVVTRALGTGDDTEADYWLIPVEDGDRYLVCSDGLTGELSDQQISQVVSSVAQPQAAVDALLEAALRSWRPGQCHGPDRRRRRHGAGRGPVDHGTPSARRGRHLAGRSADGHRGPAGPCCRESCCRESCGRRGAGLRRRAGSGRP